MNNNLIGIIGGSGVSDISGLTNRRWQRIDSPFGELDCQQLVFLPPHGRVHVIPPSGLNCRANIDVLEPARC